MNYENPLSTQDSDEPEGLSGLELAGLAALTLGGGLVANKAYKGVKKGVKKLGEAAHNTKAGVKAGIDNIGETARKINNAIKSTGLGRQIAKGQQLVEDTVQATKNTINNRSNKIDALSKAIANSRLHAIYDNEVLRNSINARVSDNPFGFPPEAFGKNGTGEVAIQKAAVAELLNKIIDNTRRPHMFNRELKFLSKNDQNILNNAWKDLSEGDRIAGLHFADKLKQLAARDSSVDMPWDKPIGLWNGLLINA